MASDRASQPSFYLRDLRDLAVLGGGACVAAVVPSALDGLMVDALIGVQKMLRGPQMAEAAALVERVLPERNASGAAIIAEQNQMRMEDFWGRLRGIGPRRWTPEIEMEGLERVHAARERGRGAILWATRMGSATAIKQGLYRAGLPLTHLSRVQHGASTASRLAVAAVSPLSCRAENKYLRERVRIPLGESLAYLQQIRGALQQNQVVSIFAERTGRNAVEAELLGKPRRFATGAPSIAYLEDAVLLPTHCFRTGPFRYRVLVEEPIPVDRSLPRKRFAADAVCELARRYDAQIRRSPADWQGWSFWGR